MKRQMTYGLATTSTIIYVAILSDHADARRILAYISERTRPGRPKPTWHMDVPVHFYDCAMAKKDAENLGKYLFKTARQRKC